MASLYESLASISEQILIGLQSSQESSVNGWLLCQSPEGVTMYLKNAKHLFPVGEIRRTKAS